MTITVDLTPDLERALREEAVRRGLAPNDVVTQILHEQLPPSRPQAARALLREIREEDATDDAQVLKSRRAEWDELKTALDRDRLSDRPLFP